MRATLRACIWEVYEGQNGPKSPVLVACKVTIAGTLETFQTVSVGNSVYKGLVMLLALKADSGELRIKINTPFIRFSASFNVPMK